ncbi:toll/interleukin-1 receptor domain-containing protein [Saccharicrinis sp. GN24d3]|uniref:toll/interleukin-1 receptor domain-containing protein n=1 Tax=Saccharicrinis sp. GN24d3 TaxID=3458416 RepID=UPI0040365768
MQDTVTKPKIYISYAWNAESETVAENIEKEFEGRGLHVIRDKKDLKYKGRISEFMKDIGSGQYVIVVVSNKYLRSENCMYELIQIFKNQHLYERIFPIVLDGVKIARATDRLDLMKHWENEVENLDRKTRELKSLGNIQGVADDLNLYAEIRNNIGQLTHILKDINMLHADQHIRSDFKQLYEAVNAKIKDDFGTIHGGGRVKKILGQSIYIFVGVLALVFAIQFFNRSNVPNQGVKEEPVNIPEPKQEQHEPVRGLSDSTSMQMDEPVKHKNKQTIPNPTYDVILVVPSFMAKQDVYVDNRLAEVVDRSLISITVRVQGKTGSHHFEINNGAQRCVLDQQITKDSLRLAMLCE